MTESSGFIKFNYKSSLIFFAFVLVINLLGNPLLKMMGASYKLSLFISNSIACSVGIPVLVLFLLKQYKGKSHAIKFILVSTFFCVLLCYFMVYKY